MVGCRPEAADRLAAATADQRLIRRSYNYDMGLDENGNLETGLALPGVTDTADWYGSGLFL